MTDVNGNIDFYLVFFVAATITGYFIPCIVGDIRKSSNKLLILFINLFFGWTVIGWIIALIVACTCERIPDKQLRILAYKKMAGVP